MTEKGLGRRNGGGDARRKDKGTEGGRMGGRERCELRQGREAEERAQVYSFHNSEDHVSA